MALTKAPEELLDKSLTSELTITTADNTTQLTLKSTDADASAGPKLDLFRDSGSPADDDILGKIRFLGDNDANSQVTYADIEARIVDASSGSADGRLELSTILAGSGSISRIFMDATETIINNDSKDLDFRVESDGNANMLFVDAGNNFIGVGTNSPQSAIHIATTGPILSFTDTNSFSDTNDRFIVRASSNQGDIQWYDDSASSTIGFMEFSPSGGVTVNDGQSSNINFIAKAGSSTNALQVDGSSGAVTINEASADADFRVESDGNSNMLFVDAGNNLVGIGTSSNTHNSNTAQSFIVSGGSGGSSTPIVMMVDEDGSVEGGSCILELSFTDDDSFSNARMIQFRDSSATQGTIECSGGGSVAYNTTSDERLKEDIQDTASKWDALKAVKVKDYKWKRSGNSDTGFIAQELNEHWPNAVSEGGEDVAQDPWSVDYGKLTPILTKVLQEAMEKIETLEAKVKELEEA